MEQLAPTSSTFSNRQFLRYALRTTLASVVSLLIARACRLPESVWAVVTTIVVMQSTLGAAWDISCQRSIGTVLGGIVALALVSFLQPGFWPLLIGMLVMGVVCSLMKLKPSAYRFAGITLAVIILPGTGRSIWIVALHRFFEVMVGIAVGMGVMYLWPGSIDAGADSPSKPGRE